MKALASRKDVQDARVFLARRKIKRSVITPRDLAEAAAESNKTFAETLRMIGVLFRAGQGAGQSPVAADIARHGRPQTS